MAARKAQKLAVYITTDVESKNVISGPIHKDKISCARNNMLPKIAISPPSPRSLTPLLLFTCNVKIGT